MKVVILAGGRGSRLGEAASGRPKALVEIAGVPVIERVMAIYAAYGHTDFIVATGFRADQISNHFEESPSIDARCVGSRANWSVDCVDTGALTATGGRIKRLASQIGGEPFMLTWTDGLADLEVDRLLSFHRSHGKLATVTAVRPPPRFGHLLIEGSRVSAFEEKPEAREGWINGAFFVLEPGVLDYIDGDDTAFERGPLPALARDGQLMAYRHEGRWNCLDTPADVEAMETLAHDGILPGPARQ
ncbi:sugar phosphate nucleotidyltransferase [uncultured Maricaulis sp.]|uniref:sugar phosphate nucleotidyltransferase n=1 Tax=uncultured Maricaulis sp. TaxID=174710 RepID=UPI00260906C7|nr:sugar phosphate nucleotidyltransferase [uncultured Maricaulis sp.]